MYSDCNFRNFPLQHGPRSITYDVAYSLPHRPARSAAADSRHDVASGSDPDWTSVPDPRVYELQSGLGVTSPVDAAVFTGHLLGMVLSRLRIAVVSWMPRREGRCIRGSAATDFLRKARASRGH